MVLKDNLEGLTESNNWIQRVGQETRLLRGKLYEKIGRTGEGAVADALGCHPDDGGLPLPTRPRRFLQGNPHYPQERMPSWPQHAGGLFDGGVPGKSMEGARGNSLPSMSGLSFGTHAHNLVGGCAEHHTTDWFEGEPPPSAERSAPSRASSRMLRSSSEASLSAASRPRSYGSGSARILEDFAPERLPTGLSSPGARSIQTRSGLSRRSLGSRSGSGKKSALSAASSVMLKREVEKAVTREMEKVLKSVAA